MVESSDLPPVSHPVRRFATTRWSLVLAAAQSPDTDGREALETLCGLYWFPIYAYIRRSGHDAADAQDLTQAFFAVLLEKNYLDAVDPQRGRFRAFLLTAVDRFLSKQRERAGAIKRGGQVRVHSIDAASGEQRYQLQAAATKTPEQLFERQWALTVLAQSLARLRERYVQEGKGELFEQLKPCLIPAAELPESAALAERLGLSPGALRMAILRLRERYRETLQAEILSTLPDGDDVTDELNRLLLALRA